MAMQSFDDWNMQIAGTAKPMSAIDHEDDTELLDWLNASISHIRDANEDRYQRIRNNRLRYQGYYHFRDNVHGRRDQPRDARRPHYFEVYTNVTQNLIDVRISQILYNKPNTVVVPSSGEAKDKSDAKMGKQVLESLKYENRITQIYYDALLEAHQAGESYCFSLWDDNRGAPHPKVKSLKGKKIPLYNSNGEKILDDAGNPVLITPPSRVGDVRYFVPLTEDVVIWPAYRFEDVQCVGLLTYMHVENAKKRWPEKADDIKASTNIRVWDHEFMDEVNLQDHVCIRHFWHRSTEWLEDGLYVLSTPDIILEEPRGLDIAPDGTDGAELGNIPCVRLIDMRLPGQFHGWSSMHNVNQLQSRYDRCTTLTDRNIFLVCHPKIMIPDGSKVAIEDMSGDALAIKYSGPVPPTIATYTAGTQEVFAYSKELKSRMEEMMKIFPISLGTPPPGTRSASQQMFWQEQQEQRASLQKLFFSQFVVELDRKVLCLCAAKYRDHDERMIRIMGSDKTWEAKQIDVTALSKSFNIRIEASTALPESKFARAEMLMNLSQIRPNLFSDEQFVSMLDFGQADRFIDLGKIAVDAAEMEFEQLQTGQELLDPEKYEEHIPHLRTHYKQIQTLSFKAQPAKVKELFFEHIGIHEMLSWVIASVNPTFAQLLPTLPQYPSFFVLPEEPQEAAPAPLPEAPIPGPEMQVPAPQVPQTQAPIPLEPEQALQPQFNGAM